MRMAMLFQVYMHVSIACARAVFVVVVFMRRDGRADGGTNGAANDRTVAIADFIADCGAHGATFATANDRFGLVICPCGRQCQGATRQRYEYYSISHDDPSDNGKLSVYALCGGLM